MSVRVNEIRFTEAGYGEPIRAKLVPKPGAKPTAQPTPSGFFDEMAALEDEGKVMLEVYYGEKLCVIDPPPPSREFSGYLRVPLFVEGCGMMPCLDL